MSIAPKQADVIVVTGIDSKKKFYCAQHFGKLLVFIGLTTTDVRYLNKKVLKYPPSSIEYILYYAYTKQLLTSIQEEEIITNVWDIADKVGVSLSLNKCLDWSKYIREVQASGREYKNYYKYYIPDVATVKIKERLLFLR